MINAIIVDDDETDAFLLESALRHYHPKLSIMRVTSAISAIDLIMGRRQDDRDLTVLVTDLVMPGTEGIALIRWATSFLNLQSAQVIAISGTTDGALKQRAIDAGAAMVLSKPENYEDLLDIAHRITHEIPVLAA